MTDEKSSSEKTFKELVARAAELDDDGKQHIDLARARVIANEVGISTAAWNEAIQERAFMDEPRVRGA